MFTSHGHHIPGTILDDTDDNQRVVARCGGPGLCNLCSVEAVQTIPGLLLPKPGSNETHTDETLDKVYRALIRAVGKNLAQDAIREMQNEGILFRERAESGG